MLDASGFVVDSNDEEMLNGLLRALQCHDDRTAPGAEMSFVSCGLNGEVVETSSSPTSSPTLSPTKNPTKNPISPTNSSVILDKEFFWDDNPFVLGVAGAAILIFVISCVFCRCCSSVTKGAKSNEKAGAALEMKRVGSNLL